MSAEICPRCQKLKPSVGPWNGEGGFARLCGSCKATITLADPIRRARLENDIRIAFQTLSGVQ